MQEEWRDVPGYEDWLRVSNFGQVRTKSRKYAITLGKFAGTERWVRGRLLKQGVTRYGYAEITLSRGNKCFKQRVHRLVAKAFVSGEFIDAFVDHLDGNKLNNRADNLEWVTKGENSKRAWKMGLCRGQPSRISDLQSHAIRVLYAHNFPPSMIAEWFGVSTSHAYQIGAGKTRGDLKLKSRQQPHL